MPTLGFNLESALLFTLRYIRPVHSMAADFVRPGYLSDPHCWLYAWARSDIGKDPVCSQRLSVWMDQAEHHRTAGGTFRCVGKQKILPVMCLRTAYTARQNHLDRWNWAVVPLELSNGAARIEQSHRLSWIWTGPTAQGIMNLPELGFVLTRHRYSRGESNPLLVKYGWDIPVSKRPTNTWSLIWNSSVKLWSWLVTAEIRPTVTNHPMIFWNS